MPRGLDISNVERTFILEALSQGVRVDGRTLNQFRRIELELGGEYGTATVRLGRTRYEGSKARTSSSPQLTQSRVLAQVSAEVTKPLDDRKFDGIFTIVTELSPIASAAFEVGRLAFPPMQFSQHADCCLQANRTGGPSFSHP
jgi:exosome complex component RRP45